jgi:uncharacterized protein (TIGR03067 family)
VKTLNSFGLLLTALFVLSTPAMAVETPVTDLAKLQGTWDTIDFKGDGVMAPDEVKKRLKLIFKEDTLAIPGLSADTRNYAIKLDPDKSPKVIYLTPMGGPFQSQTVPGIYELDGDNLKFVMPNQVIDTPPKAFEVPKGSALALFISKRKK